MFMYPLRRLLALSVVALAFAYGSIISAQERITVVSRTIESGEICPTANRAED
jgi:hypothetical protein